MIAKRETINQPSCEVFLHCRTPQAWVVSACQSLPTLLLDHAHCELKAAHTALALIRRYPQQTALCQQLSRLAREELRHFEQVMSLMLDYQAEFGHLSASRYAGALMSNIARQEPTRLIETLMVAGIIEARSCERFMVLVPHLPDALATFYQRLIASESRHYLLYIDHARRINRGQKQPMALDHRLNELLALERLLIESPDTTIRFHSGVCADLTVA